MTFVRPRLPLLASLLLGVAGATAHAAGAAPARTREVLRLAGAGRTIPVAPERRDWGALQQRYPTWKVWVDERSGMPSLASGRGIEWFPEGSHSAISFDAIEARAREFLRSSEDMPSALLAHLVRDDQASARLREDQWKLVFRIEVDGVRVESARIEVVVHRGRLVLFGSTHGSLPAISGVPQVGPGAARAILDGYVAGRAGDLRIDEEPQLLLIAVDEDGPPAHRLLWRFRMHDSRGPETWIGEVDAHRGVMDAFYEATHYAGVLGGVFPEQPGGDCADGGCELDDVPMPYADVSESGGGSGFADAYGRFECADPEASFETSLGGRYVVLNDGCGPLLATASCSGRVQLGVKQGENCAVDAAGPPGNTAAARTSYYHVNRVAEVARFHNPSNVWLQGSVELDSNWNGTCNASYGGGAIFVYRQSATCANSGEIETVATHEWGHGYDQNDGGGWDNTSEAYGDMVAMFASRQSCFAKGLFTDGSTCSGYGDTCLSCTGFRDHDWAARTLGTPATPQGFVVDYCNPGGGNPSPCGGGVHCESYPIDEAMWDLAVRDLPAAGLDPTSAWQLVERLWYSSRAGSGGGIYHCALPSSDSCGSGTWYQQLRVADDDDADLSNGTPHAAEIYAAFARHNIACGASTDPENQSTSSCPALTAPALSLTAQPTGGELSWSFVPEAVEYVVYRGDLGCQRQLVPVAVVAGTTWLDPVGDPGVTRSYRVEAVGANPACRSPVSNCASGPLGPRLQKNAQRWVEPPLYTNGNGVPDPGETVELPVTLFNGGQAEALGVTGRLRTVDPAQGRVLEPLASWVDIPVDTAFESNAPHFALTLLNAGVACGETVRLELEMDALDTPTRTTRFDFRLGEKTRDFPKTVNAALSRLNTSPVVSTLDIAEATTIGELDVSVDITHPIPGDLVVELTSPQGTTVRLHDRTPGTDGIATTYDELTAPDGPGTMADFTGEPLAGTWSLSVRNTVFGGGTGTFNHWTLHVVSQGAFGCSEVVCAETTPTAPVDGLTVGKAGQDLSFAWEPATGVAGYHLLQAMNPAFSSNVDLAGQTSGTTLSLPGGVPATPDVAYFQARSVNVCHQESP